MTKDQFEVFKYGTSGDEWEVRLGERTVCVVFQRDEADEIATALNESRGPALIALATCPNCGTETP